MAISRQEKEAQVTALKEELSKSSLSVLASYSGLSVQDSQILRKQIKDQGGSFRVVKNAMLKLAVADTHKEVDLSELEGPVAMAFGYDDPIIAAKVIADHAKKNDSLKPIMAIDNQGQVLSAEEVGRLADLPPKEVLLGQVVGVVAAPLSGMVGVLSGNLRGLVTVLDKAAQSKS
ncbi:MAG: 50S ribosomal protein L10 [Candidatus Saccharimonadales bacterium]